MAKHLFTRKGTPPPVRHMLMITMFLFIIMIVFSIVIVDKGIRPTLMEIAGQKTKEFATRAINQAVRFAEDYEFEDLITMTTDNNGNITTYGWNSAIVSNINRVSTDRVEEFFARMNDGKSPDYEESHIELDEYGDTVDELAKKDPTVVEIPIGQASGSTLLANLGPKIPVNLDLVGSVETDVIREVEDIGINGALVTIYIIVEAEVQIIIPFTSEIKPVSTKIYIDSRVVMGVVPDFYGGGGEGPSISIPKDQLTDNE